MMTKMVAKDSLRQQGTDIVMLSCPFLLMIMMTELMCFCLRKPPQHLSPPLVGPFKPRCCSWGVSPQFRNFFESVLFISDCWDLYGAALGPFPPKTIAPSASSARFLNCQVPSLYRLLAGKPISNQLNQQTCSTVPNPQHPCRCSQQLTKDSRMITCLNNLPFSQQMAFLFMVHLLGASKKLSF